MKKLLMVMVLGASAVAASAQGLPRRSLGSRLARPAQTASQTADAAKDREARKARAAQRPQFSVGSSTAEFDRECETLFADIVREAEICQTNLAEYATYPYWPDAMGVVSNFCAKNGCMVVDAGHHFGTWRQGRGEKVYVATSDFDRHRRFVPWVQSDGDGGFRLVSRGGVYTNVACRYVGAISCYDAEGRFEELYDSVDKLPRMQDCLNADVNWNYAEQDRWMKAHGFLDEGGGREAELKLDVARKNAISRLESLRTILSEFPQWKAGSKWYEVCDVGAELRGPSASGSYRPRLGGLRSPATGINTNDVVFVRMNERFLNLGRNQDRLIEEVVSSLTGIEFGSSVSTNGILDLKFNLGSYESCTFARAPGSGVVSGVTLIAEFDRSCEQKAVLEKLDQGLSALLSAIGMDRDTLAYNKSQRGARGLSGGLLRPAVNQSWNTVQSLSRRFSISRGRQESGEYVVTISAQKNVAMPTTVGGSLRARRLQRQCEAQAARDAERQAQAAQEKAQREAERAEPRQQLLAIQEELKKVRQAKASVAKSEFTASCITNKPTSGKSVVAKKLGQCEFLLNTDFKKNVKFYLCLFSASWCPPCRKEMPRIAKTYAETLKDDPDIELIHFSRDQNDEKALAWAKEHDVKFPVVKPNGGNPLDLHSRGIPHLFIVKADGTLVEDGHPMRIFNEEKFRELKGMTLACGVKPQTGSELPENSKATVILDGYTWSYSSNNEEATIISSTGKLYERAVSPCPIGDLVIPSLVAGKSVTGIGKFALCNCPGIMSIEIPASVTRIGEWAFSGCSKLTTVTLPSGLTDIKECAFANCPNLLAIGLSAANPTYKVVDGVLYTKDMKRLVTGPGGLTSVLIPVGVVDIGDHAFRCCRELKFVTIPLGVKRIGSNAFGATAIKSIDIPSSVESIGEFAFFCCLGLKSVLMSEGVQSIGKMSFCQCRELESVMIPSSVRKVEYEAFFDCSKLSSVTMCGERPEAEDKVFEKCANLKSIHVPANAKSWAGMKEWQGIPLVFDGPELSGEQATADVSIAPKVMTGPYGIRMEVDPGCEKGAEHVLGRLRDDWLPRALRYYGDPFVGKAPTRVYTIKVRRNDGSGKSKYTGPSGGFLFGHGNIGLARDSDKYEFALDWLAASVLTVCEEPNSSSFQQYVKRFMEGETKGQDPVPQIKKDIKAGLAMEGDGRRKRYPYMHTAMWAVFEELREKHPKFMQEYYQLKNSRFAEGRLPEKLSFDQVAGLLSEVTHENVTELFKKYGIGADPSKGPSANGVSRVSDKTAQGKIVVADKLQSCDFLLNKDFKKNVKFYLCLFSASWCPPCRREMPRIAKTYAETLKNDPDIELIHFSCDRDDEKALAWAKEHDVKFPVVKPNGGNPLDLHSRGIPHLFIVKADGTLLEEGHPMKIFTEKKLRELKSE